MRKNADLAPHADFYSVLSEPENAWPVALMARRSRDEPPLQADSQALCIMAFAAKRFMQQLMDDTMHIYN